MLKKIGNWLKGREIDQGVPEEMQRKETPRRRRRTDRATPGGAQAMGRSEEFVRSHSDPARPTRVRPDAEQPSADAALRIAEQDWDEVGDRHDQDYAHMAPANDNPDSKDPPQLHGERLDDKTRDVAPSRGNRRNG